MIKAIVLTAVLAASGVSVPKAEKPAEKPVKLAAICFKSGEQTSGMNKICYYDCLGSQVAINVSSVSLCPLSINR